MNLSQLKPTNDNSTDPVHIDTHTRSRAEGEVAGLKIHQQAIQRSISDMKSNPNHNPRVLAHEQERLRQIEEALAQVPDLKEEEPNS